VSFFRFIGPKVRKYFENGKYGGYGGIKKLQRMVGAWCSYLEDD
jgi:hypothetical protein